MTLLSKIISVERRYQRSINIEQDFASGDALDGYIFPESAKMALLSMAEQIAHGGQGSFTWTGPYGSGKSSLAIALASLLVGSKDDRKNASKKLDAEWSEQLWSLLNPGKESWKFIPVIGANDPIYTLVGSALKSAGVIGKSVRLTASSVLKAIEGACKNTPDPILLFVDEMGKTLEHAVRQDGDIYFYQGLAEIANRSEGKFVIIGVLHQAFQEYASTLSRRSKEEWAKIQGRYIDIAVDIRADEQITLISKAIQCSKVPSKGFEKLATKVAAQVNIVKKGFGASMASTLGTSWPLHPVVTCLLGPISRKGSGQNYRSVFSFLNSAEPAGFQDFISHNNQDALFTLSDLWRYILLNQKGAILASSDGHKWAIAIEAIERAESLGMSELEVQCLQSITLLDWLKEGSGLGPTKDALSLCLSASAKKLETALKALVDASLITYKRYNGSYGLFEGSDFDIDAAISEVKLELGDGVLRNISKHVSLPTVIAKRHYHETGTLRWANFTITPLDKLKETIAEYGSRETGIALGVIYFRTNSENDAEVKQLLELSRQDLADDFELLLGEVVLSQELQALFEDIEVLGHILREQKELAGDRIARREMRERIAHTAEIAKDRFFENLDGLTFVGEQSQSYQYDWQEIGRLVDQVARERFHKAPYINSELLNRERPSAQANLALKKLLYALLRGQGEEALGLTGFPAERGLLEALLVSSDLYKEDNEGKWNLCEPSKATPKLKALWKDTHKYLKKNKNAVTNLESIYDFWSAPPYGLTRGVCPLYASLFLMNNWSELAFYRQALFRPELTEIDIDVLLKSPRFIDIRRMDVSEEVKELLSEMTNLAIHYNGADNLAHSETIDVAKALIGAFDKLPSFASRTQMVSKNARNVRSLFKGAHDPNKFLLEDIPGLKQFSTGDQGLSDAQKIAYNLKSGLDELFEAYPTVLRRLEQFMLSELEVPNISSAALKELSERALNISEVSEDHVIEAFINRLSRYDGSEQHIESLVSLAAGKPTHNWIDADVKRAEIRLSEFSRTFKHLETFARIKGRENKRTSMAMVVDLNNKSGPVEVQFNVLNARSDVIADKADMILRQLSDELSGDRDIILSVLAKASEKLIEDSEIEASGKAAAS